MKRILKIVFIVLGSVLLLAVVIGYGGWWYTKSILLDFEDDYVEQKEVKEISVDGLTFYDRNGNGDLDIYEDSRRSSAERAADLLSKMTLEEKIHLLKGSGIASAMGRVEPGEGIPGAVGTIVPTPRLGVPTVYLSDGRQVFGLHQIARAKTEHTIAPPFQSAHCWLPPGIRILSMK